MKKGVSLRDMWVLCSKSQVLVPANRTIFFSNHNSIFVFRVFPWDLCSFRNLGSVLLDKKIKALPEVLGIRKRDELSGEINSSRLAFRFKRCHLDPTSTSLPRSPKTGFAAVASLICLWWCARSLPEGGLPEELEPEVLVECCSLYLLICLWPEPGVGVLLAALVCKALQHGVSGRVKSQLLLPSAPPQPRAGSSALGLSFPRRPAAFPSVVVQKQYCFLVHCRATDTPWPSVIGQAFCKTFSLHFPSFVRVTFPLGKKIRKHWKE